MKGQLIEFPTGKTIIEFPTFQILAGDYDFPLWFAREGKELLDAKEPYTLCAGIGYVLRYWRLVTKNINPELTVPRFESHILEYPLRFPIRYFKTVVNEFIHELDVIDDGLNCLKASKRRKTADYHALLRSVKTQRDDMESVQALLYLMRSYDVDAKRVDDKANSILPILQDDHRYMSIRSPRLNTLYDHFPQNWWGVKGTL